MIALAKRADKTKDEDEKDTDKASILCMEELAAETKLTRAKARELGYQPLHLGQEEEEQRATVSSHI